MHWQLGWASKPYSPRSGHPRRTQSPKECLDHLIIINERHLRAVLREYEVYYNNGRPHRTLDLETPTGPPARASPLQAGRIVARPVPGGLHHEYKWQAA